MPGEVKILTRTEVKTIRDLEVHMPAMDLDNPPEQTDDNIGPDASEVGLYDEPPVSQSDKFEREMASEQEPGVPPEETSSVAPEEVEEPAEN